MNAFIPALAADGRSYYALDGGKLVRFDPFTGQLDRTYPLRGAWTLADASRHGATPAPRTL